MAKEQGPSNRIGAIGESAFHLFATKQGLLPTRPDRDVGLDFVCQVNEDHLADRPTRIAPVIVGFAVRSTAADDGRVRLSRDDADFLLRFNDPVGLVLVDERTDPETFHHRMMDEGFANELANFLASEQQTMSLTPARCRGTSDFRGDVIAAIVPGEVERRRLAIARQRLDERIGIVRLQIQRDEDGDVTVVTALQLWNLFRTMSDVDRELLHYATFGAPSRLQERLAAMEMREDFISELDRLPEPYIVGGGVQNAASQLRVEGPEGEAEITLRYTRNGGHYGYVHDAGFALTVSDRRQENGIWVHAMGALADPDVALDLGEHPDLLVFLAACVPGATVIDDDVPGFRFPVEQFAGLDRIGVFASAMRDASALPGWSWRFAQLRDAFDDETMTSVQWLGMAARDPARLPMAAFVRELPGSPDPEGEPGRWKVPVIVNSARAGAVLWLLCAGELFVRDGGVTGVRTQEHLDVLVEIADGRLVKATDDPEYVFTRDGIAMVVREHGWELVEPLEDRGPDEFVDLTDDQSSSST
jgi:hypothetical protein